MTEHPLASILHRSRGALGAATFLAFCQIGLPSTLHSAETDRLPAADAAQTGEKTPATDAAAGAATTGSADGSTSGSMPQAASDELMIGDKLRLSFYEQLDLGKGADAGLTADTRTFYQRLDLTGEHVVSADGSIGVALLGRFVVNGMTTEEAQTEIMAAYESVMGRPGQVDIALLDRKPIFVTGVVKTPGSFRFEPGMIALQAIALAGGFDREVNAVARVLDAQRERERHWQAVSRLESLNAKRVRLLRQRDLPAGGEQDKAMQETEGGEDIAGTPVAGEMRLLGAEASVMSQEDQLQDAKLTDAKTKVESLTNLSELVERQIGVRGERLRVLQQMQGRGLSTLEIMWNAQKDVSDFEMQRERLAGEIQSARHSVATIEAEATKLETDRRVEIERMLVDVEAEINLQESIIRSSEAMIASLETANSGARLGAPLRMRLVRRAGEQALEMDAEETTELLPGDVVKVEAVPTGDAKGAVSNGAL